MSSDGTISSRDASRISLLFQAQDISHELIYATCRENACLRQKIMDLEKKVQLCQQSLSEKTQANTQLVSDLRHSQKAAVDSQASVNNMHFQLRQQAVVMTNVNEHNAEKVKLNERELQKRIQMEEQLDVERHLNAQFVDFVEAFNFMDREDFENPIGDKVGFDDILASRPAIACHMEKMKQENASKDKILEEYKGLHQHLYDMLQSLLGYHIGECEIDIGECDIGECDIGEELETTTACVAMISRATPPSNAI